MNERSWIRLSKQERQELGRLLHSGLQPVRTVLRALALRRLAEGQPIRHVAKNVALTPKTVWLTSQRYRQGGLERALYERPRPGKTACWMRSIGNASWRWRVAQRRKAVRAGRCAC